MRITYVNHACLLFEIGGKRIVTDPWFCGPAYARQWHAFPKPVNAELADEAEVLLISHAHEDHLHEPTLRRLGKSKQVFYPFNWYAGTVDWIRTMGYDDVTEAASCRAYELSGGAKLTYVVNGHDSIMVIEDGDEVVVNVNDALHSAEPDVIDTFTNYLRHRWPRIDAVFCGFGGASYYPNTIRGPGKDDRAVAMLREQLFAHNFCRIVGRLAPRIAIPFAADFALLADEQRWINDTRFPRECLPSYFRDYFGAGHIEIMYSGDRLTDGRIEPCSPLRDRLVGDRLALPELLAEQYPAITSALSVDATAPSSEVDELRQHFALNVTEQSAFYDAAIVDGLKFSVYLRDVSDRPWFNVHLDSRKATVSRTSKPLDEAVAEIETTAEVLAQCLASEWGGDAIIIGYACVVKVRRQEDLQNGRGRACAELCVRHPRPGTYAKQNPLRVARFAAQTSFALRSRLKQKARGVFGQGRSVVNGSHWLSRSPAEIRRICDLPDYRAASIKVA